MVEKSIKTVVDEIKVKIDSIDTNIQSLQNIEIKVTNGKEKRVTYRRTEFFQMLYDRGSVWKEKARITARDVLLFGGIIFLIVDRVIGLPL